MQTWCNFRLTHAEDKLLHDDGKGGPPSHGICIPCRDVFLANLPKRKKEQADAHDLSASA